MAPTRSNTGAAGRLGQRRRNEIDAQCALVDRPPACQLDPTEPALREFSHEIAVAVAERNVGGYRPDADPGESQFGAPGKPSERRQKPHATEPPREKALTPNLIPAVGQEPDQRLQGAVEQGRVNQIRLDILGDGRGIEMCDRCVRSSDFDQAHGSKPSAVIEPREPRQVIEGLLVDPTASRSAIRKAQRPAGIGFGAETSNSMNRERFVR